MTREHPVISLESSAGEIRITFLFPSDDKLLRNAQMMKAELDIVKLAMSDTRIETYSGTYRQRSVADQKFLLDLPDEYGESYAVHPCGRLMVKAALRTESNPEFVKEFFEKEGYDQVSLVEF